MVSICKDITFALQKKTGDSVTPYAEGAPKGQGFRGQQLLPYTISSQGLWNFLGGRHGCLQLLSCRSLNNGPSASWPERFSKDFLNRNIWMFCFDGLRSNSMNEICFSPRWSI